MKEDNLIIILVIIVISGASIPFIVNYVYGATETTDDRIFIKDSNFNSLITTKYNDGKELSYDIVNPNTEQIVIHNWSKISELDKQVISSELQTSGFKDISEFDSRVK